MKWTKTRPANPASPSLIDLTAPAKPEPLGEFTPAQREHAVTVLRGITVADVMGTPEDEIVREAARRLRAGRPRPDVVVLP